VSNDTPRSVIDKGWVEKHRLETVEVGKGVGVGGEVLTSKTKVEELRIGELRINDFEILVVDLSRTSSKFEMDINGVVGNDILRGFKAIIDYDKGTLKL